MIGGQLRDRGRVLTTVQPGTRVNGAKQKVEQPGPWFRCYYAPGNEGETPLPGGWRRRRTGAQLVTGRRALDGSQIEIKATDAVEIDSLSHGVLRLDVTGVERLVRGRTMLGWLATLGKTSRKAAG